MLELFLPFLASMYLGSFSVHRDTKANCAEGDIGAFEVTELPMVRRKGQKFKTLTPPTSKRQLHSHKTPKNRTVFTILPLSASSKSGDGGVMQV